MTFIRNFTPNWFTVGMGIGIMSIVAFLYPHGPQWMVRIATVLWLFNTVLVRTLLVLMLLRWILNWTASVAVLRNLIQSMFLGAVPMALTTVVNGFIDMGFGLFGAVSIKIA